MNRDTGQLITDDLAHIRQSVRDILTTPIGSRLMRRDYGSLIPELIDQPANGATRLRLLAASVMALQRWEPRLSVQSIEITAGLDGKATLDLAGVRRDGPRSGSAISLNNLVLQ